MQKKKNICFKISCTLVFLIVIGISLLPTWLSSSYGTTTALKWINRSLEGTLSVEKVDLHWLGTQRLEKIQYTDSQGNTKLSFLNCETKTSLLSLLFGRRTFGQTTIDNPYFYLSNPQSSKKEEKKSSRKPFFQTSSKKLKIPQFDNSLEIINGTFIFASDKHASPVTLSEIYVNKKGALNHISITAISAQDSIQGSIKIEGKWDKEVYAHVQLKDFPLPILDHFTQSKIYTEMVGPRLNLDMYLQKNDQDILFFEGVANSANFTAHVEGKTENQTLVINPKSHLELTLTPSLFKQFLKEEQRKNWELASKTPLEIRIKEGSFPLRTTDFSWKDLILQAEAHLERAEIHHHQLGNYSLNHFKVDMDLHDHLKFKYQGEMQGKEATKLEGDLALTSQGDWIFNYAFQEFPVTLLELISSNLEKNIRAQLGSKCDLKGEGAYHAHNIDTFFKLDTSNIHLAGHLFGHLPELNFDLSGTHHLYGNKSKILGQSIKFTLGGNAKIKKTAVMIPFFKGKLFNPYIEMDFSGKIGKEGKEFSLHQVELIAQGNIKNLPIEEAFAESTLQNGKFCLRIDGFNNLITAKAEGHSFDAYFELKNCIQNHTIALNRSTLNFACNLADFPLSLLSPLVGKNLDLAPLLGKTIHLRSKGSYTPDQDPRLTIDLQAQGEGLQASLNLAFDPTFSVKQLNPSYISWEITPERYEALLQAFSDQPPTTPFVLTRPTKIELNIHHFSCPTNEQENLGEFLCQSGFVGNIRLGSMEFKNRSTNERLIFDAVSGSIQGENFSKAINFTLNGKMLAPNIPLKEDSLFTFTGKMFNLWTPEGKLNKDNLTIQGDLNLHLLPVHPLTEIFPLDHQTRLILQAVLGDVVNAKISGEISHLTGPVDIDIKSSNFKAVIPLELKKTAFYLRDYVNAEMTLTPAVNELLLKDINPLIVGAYSDHPIKVYIDPKGFILPIKPFSLDKVIIKKAVVDIGKIRIKNGGQIQSLMEFLNAKELSSWDGLMEAWFTPIYMKLQNGVATYKRFDALLGQNVHIALWGGIHLINEKVDMTLAIAPTTLYERFKISGLTNKDMFQVKMKGTTSKLDLDWSSAYSRIAWIVARSSVGLITDILGGVLEQLVSNLGGDNVPPPTTDPLPWEAK